jgi:hypothetical protein
MQKENSGVPTLFHNLNHRSIIGLYANRHPPYQKSWGSKPFLVDAVEPFSIAVLGVTTVPCPAEMAASKLVNRTNFHACPNNGALLSHPQEERNWRRASAERLSGLKAFIL